MYFEIYTFIKQFKYNWKEIDQLLLHYKFREVRNLFIFTSCEPLIK